jgi:glyoxylase I family protein
VVVRDLEASLRFYRNGLGLDLLQDRQVDGDWPDLFGAPSRRVRAVFLGDAGVPDDQAGVLELNVFDGGVPDDVARVALFNAGDLLGGGRPGIRSFA